MTPRRRSTTDAPVAPADDISSGTNNGSRSGASTSFQDLMRMGSGDDTAAAVAVKDTREATEKTRSRALAHVQAIEEKVVAAGGKAREGVREKILSADFAGVRALADEEEGDFAEALEALSQIAQGMDVEFQKLIEPSAEENKVVGAAKARVTDIEQQIEMRKKAGFMVNFLNSKEKALAKFQSELDAAKIGVTQAEAKVQQMMRQRLMSANMQSSIDAYVGVSKKTVQIMERRIKEIAEQIVILGKERETTLADKGGAAEELKRVGEHLESLEMTLKVKENELDGLVNGTPECTAKEKEVSDLRVKVEEIRGEKDAVLTVFQSKEIFLQRVELSLQTTIKLKARHRARILRLVSDTETRIKTYAARLVTMQVMADQQFDTTIDQIGVRLDEQTDEFMASSMVAADKALMESLEAQPDKLARHAAVRHTIAQHISQMRNRGAAVEQALRDRYGIELGESSFFNYKGDGTDGGPAELPPKS